MKHRQKINKRKRDQKVKHKQSISEPQDNHTHPYILFSEKIWKSTCISNKKNICLQCNENYKPTDIRRSINPKHKIYFEIFPLDSFFKTWNKQFKNII